MSAAILGNEFYVKPRTAHAESMKPKVSPTRREVFLDDDELIVSKTDTSGRITYANRRFIELSGYTESELLHIQHSIIRHPDMPRGVFLLLWETIKEGKEFIGYVKNMCKSGDHFWTFANVTPSFDSAGRLVGYYSARRKAKPAGIAQCQPLYDAMLKQEASISNPKEAAQSSLRWLKNSLAQSGTTYEAFVLEI